MVFKLSIAAIALAAVTNAAHYKRVVCPDGNVASNEAVRSKLAHYLAQYF